MFENKSALTADEELYCMRYELEILSGIVNQNMLERWLPGFCKLHTHQEHMYRYEWVKDFVKNKKVLDIACGTGFGSYILASNGGAAEVTGCDIDERSVKYASYKNKHPHISFSVQNAEAIRLEKKFDIVVSFETIEHLNKPEAFLQNVNAMMNDDGFFFVSTPISYVDHNEKPDNIYHVTEWGFKRFQAIVSQYFSIQDIFLQLYNVRPKTDIRKLSRLFHRAGLKKKTKHVAIEKMDPFKWIPADIPAATIGTDWIGYQILQCKKK